MVTPAAKDEIDSIILHLRGLRELLEVQFKSDKNDSLSIHVHANKIRYLISIEADLKSWVLQ